MEGINKKFEPGNLFGGEPETPEVKRPKTIKDYNDKELTDLKRTTERKSKTGEVLTPREEEYLEAMRVFEASRVRNQEKK